MRHSLKGVTDQTCFLLPNYRIHEKVCHVLHRFDAVAQTASGGIEDILVVF